ncbi:vascular endothelial growth factor receptor 1-like isoform X2 [Artemia franciscana]|uniref:receptor protein-tyrosine kinase n=2 Tax=Artemia franciscana TaxID=6661 RepID=A0AA88I6Q8_ARTSF|nr:hypothetical protein QYM36_010786 [Artemia franciscana]
MRIGYIFTISLILGLLSSVTGSSILLYPDQEEEIILSGAALKLRCEARKETYWHFNVYPDSDLNKQQHDIEERSNVTSWRNPDSDFSFISELTVSNASYLDTGYFTCAHVGTTNFKDIFNAKRIYIYVDDDVQLIAAPEADIHLISGMAWRVTTLPCKPTLPWISMDLYKDSEKVYPAEDNEVDQRVIFFPREGFIINPTALTDSGHYECVATKGDAVEHYGIIVHVTPDTGEPDPHISRDNRHVEMGGNFSLDCTVHYPVGGYIYLNWTFPDMSGLTDGRIHISETTRADSIVGSNEYEAINTITITRARASDRGSYICMASNHEAQGTDTVFVDIFEENVNVLNVTIDVKNIQVTAGSVARWVAVIHAAYPKPEIIWKNQKGEEMKTEKNFRVMSTDVESVLEITKVQSRDSGCYTFFAQAGNVTKVEGLTLRVREKPTTSIESTGMFVVHNDKHTITCSAEGFPLAIIEWKFRNCSLPNSCEEEFKPLEVSNPNQLRNSRTLISTRNAACDLVRVRSTLQLVGIQSGEYLCLASNEFGKSEAQTRFYVVPSNEPVDLSARTTELYEGENLSLRCAISLFNFTREIKWYYQATSTDPISDLVEGQTGVLIFKGEDAYGYYQTLEKPGIRLSDSGQYICEANSLRGELIKQSVKISIMDQSSPLFTSHNMGKKIEVEKGKPLVLQCNFTGRPPPSVTWLKDRREIERSEEYLLSHDGNSATLKVPFIRQSGAGIYSCSLESIAGSASIESEVVVIDPPLSAWIPIVGVILAITVIILLALLLVKMKKERQRKAFLALHNLEKFEEGNPEIINPEQTLDEQAELLPYNKKSWEFPKERLKLGKQLGVGAFGRVVQAEALGIVEGEAKTTVAVKMLKPSPGREALAALVKELKIMTNLGKHLNVVNLLGACTRNIDKGELLLIVEYCKYGNLLKYVQKKRNNFVDQIDRTNSKIDISVGMDRLLRSTSTSSQRNYVNIRPDRSASSTAPLIPPDSPFVQYTPSPTSPTSPTRFNGHENAAMTYLRRMSNGATTGGEDSAGQMASPWASNYRGDIDDSPLFTKDLLCWSYQILCGMEYLASRKVCHGDLAARNILLSENNIVKISDFGLSRDVYKSGLYTKKSNTPMPVKWMAPESITTLVFSTQSDVWAFGITIWELFSLGEMPYAGIEPNAKFVEGLITGAGLLPMPRFATKDIYDVMRECWHKSPKERPSFSELKEHVGNLLDETTKQMYIDLNQSYMNMNRTQFQDRVDYLTQMANPVYENFDPQLMSDHEYVNTPSKVVQIGDDGYLSPKQINTNSEGYVSGNPSYASGSEVFIFPDSTAGYRRLSKLEEEPNETQPMLEDSDYLQPIKLTTNTDS